MVWMRYLLYFLGVAGLTYLLTSLEVAYPGSLRLQVFAGPGDTLGTSEFSPIELMQPFILGICGLIMAWVATHYVSQRPIAIPFGGLALAFIIREVDYFLDRYFVDNLWQFLIGVAGALVIAYTYRHRRRLQVALGRLWPSPGLVFLFAGASILFVFARLIGHEPFWQSILGDSYQRIVTLAVEELIELMGYLLWLFGSIEYAYQVRAMIDRAPQPAAVKRRRTQRRSRP